MDIQLALNVHAHSDLGNISNPDPAIRKSLSDSIRDACINVGFLYGARWSVRIGGLSNDFVPVKNHGIPDEVIGNALSASKEFFSLPLEKKKEVDNSKTPNFKGYNSVLSSVNDPDSDGDMHEGFEFGWEELVPKVNDEKRANDGVMAGANIWPTDPVDFGKAVLTY